MGVSGSGKTTAGVELAKRLGWQFVEADEFHPAENIEKMSAGIPLTDADRWPWLDAIAGFIEQSILQGKSTICACSALRRSYRQRLANLKVISAGPEAGLEMLPELKNQATVRVDFVYLRTSRDLLKSRLDERKNHFMKADLLDSQLNTLEEPSAEEALVVNAGKPLEEIVETIVAKLMLHQSTEST